MLDFIYPPICISCSSLLSDNSQKICSSCWDAVKTVTKDHPLYWETRNRLIASGSIDDLVSCYIFEREGPTRHIAHALKYREYRSLGINLGEKIGNLIADWEISFDVIVPVPLHRIKYRERGYNQSEYIARGIAGVTGKPAACDIVRRKRYTQTQTKLNIEERYLNMKDAFEILPDASKKISGKTCLLVDDIITTGATINSCAKEILAAGTNSIIAASAALAK
ncbi:MAG: ComF family protein [Bacteroidetes bacterium]|nr:ComF family protein [Bacteroidota bacterium]